MVIQPYPLIACHSGEGRRRGFECTAYTIMELEQDDTGTAPTTTTTNPDGGSAHAAPDAMLSSATTNFALPTIGNSENLVPDVDMGDVFYFDVGRPSKQPPKVSGSEDQKQPPATASEDGHGAPGISKKRKSPGLEPEVADLEDLWLPQPSKKARLESPISGVPESSSGRVKDKSVLPPEVWHHIFTFCPPKTLGNLLSVNKLFHDYLAPSPCSRCEHPRSRPEVKGGRPILSPLKPNSIWKASRRLFWPNMPAPLRSMSEWKMWRLICSTRCQECGRSDTRDPASSTASTQAGPGLDGVSVVWPLGIRVCGPCLLEKTVKVRSPSSRLIIFVMH